VFSVTTASFDSQFFRHPSIAGVELRVVDGQKQEWSFYSQAYQFVFSRSWSGKIWHRREQRMWSADTVLVTAPGQLLLTYGRSPGIIACLTIDAEIMKRVLAPQQLVALDNGAELTLSSEAFNALCELHDNSNLWRFPELLRSRLETFASGLSQCQVQAPRPPKPRRGGADAVISRIDVEEAVALDLRALSQHTGTSRFAALRAFKRYFGLPPHTFQLQMRVDQAQLGLRAGQTPAQVAVDCGFFDQSHLTRHFKRVLGTTPAQYARGHVPALAFGVAR
jgi:AraC-like DNA-binding protein